MAELIAKLWRGDQSLPMTFWVWGVVAIIGMSVASQFVVMGLAFSGLVKGVLFIGIVLAVAMLGYFVLVLVGIWRSAGNYSGPLVWKFAARTVVVLFAMLNIAGLVLAGMEMSVDTHDSTRSSRNIDAQLKTAVGYPYAGFWKRSCSDNFGLAIEPEGAGLYTVSFCGPGGCFKPGTYRPSTKIDGDPLYKVIDATTMEVEGKDGFSAYHLCSPPAAPTPKIDK